MSFEADVSVARRQLLASVPEGFTPGPLRIGIYDPDRDPVELFSENLSHGSGDVWIAIAPEHLRTVGGWEDRPAHAVITCITGNGPASEANARLYLLAPDLVDALRAADEQVDTITGERDRLRAVLACERGESAPEGWGWVECGGWGWAWVRGMESPDKWIAVQHKPGAGWYIRLGAAFRNLHDQLGVTMPTALEALEAADRAAGEVSRG